MDCFQSEMPGYWKNMQSQPIPERDEYRVSPGSLAYASHSGKLRRRSFVLLVVDAQGKQHCPCVTPIPHQPEISPADISARIAEIRPVKGIEHLPAELDPSAFFHRKVLRQDDIPNR